MTNIVNVPKIPAFSVSVEKISSRSFAPKKEVTLYAFTRDIRLLVGKRVFDVKANDILLSLPYAVCIPCGFVEADYGYSLSFPEVALRTLSPSLSLRFSDGALSIAFTQTGKARLWSLISALNESEDVDFFSAIAVFSILEQECLPEMDNCNLVPLPKLLRQALTYLYEHPDEKTDAKMLAQRYDVSQSTLLRVFRKYLCTTPLKYQTAVKLCTFGFVQDQ